jgi:integrase
MTRPALIPGHAGEPSRPRRVTVTRHGEQVPMWRCECSVRPVGGATTTVRVDRPTQREARAAIRTLVTRRLGPAALTGPAATPVMEMVQWVVEDKRAASAAAGTVDAFQDRAKATAQVVGGMTLGQADVVTISRALEPLRDRPGTERGVRAILRAAFDESVRRGWMTDNPIRRLKPMSQTAPDMRVLSEDEKELLLELLSRPRSEAGRSRRGPEPDHHRLALGARILMGTGIRTGELLGLQWGDLSGPPQHMELHIQATLVCRRGHDGHEGYHTYRQPHPKTPRGDRVLTLPRDLADLLAWERGQATPSVPWILPSQTSGPTDKATFGVMWRTALKGTSLEGVTPKVLRKTAGTAIAETAGLIGARDQLGHTSTVVAERFYVRRDNHGPDAAAALRVPLDGDAQVMREALFTQSWAALHPDGDTTDPGTLAEWTALWLGFHPEAGTDEAFDAWWAQAHPDGDPTDVTAVITENRDAWLDTRDARRRWVEDQTGAW